jgi:hypothetical protein
MNKAIDLLQHLLEQIQNTVVHFTPIAWQILCNIKRIDSLNDIIGGLIAGGVAITLGRYVKSLCRWVLKVSENDSDGFSTFCAGTFAIAVYLVGIASAIFSIYTLTNIWEWVGIFYPGLAIAHDLYIKAVGS